jgi:hypothetical protein
MKAMKVNHPELYLPLHSNNKMALRTRSARLPRRMKRQPGLQLQDRLAQ